MIYTEFGSTSSQCIAVAEPHCPGKEVSETGGRAFYERASKGGENAALSKGEEILPLRHTRLSVHVHHLQACRRNPLRTYDVVGMMEGKGRGMCWYKAGEIEAMKLRFQELCAARKKLRLKAQQTRRLKARVSSLAGVIKVLQKNSLFQYKEAAISYIAGFIVKKIEQKVTCMPCSYALTSADSVHPFVTLKNRGGLQKPSPGITSVCQVTERCFQRLLNANEGKAPQGRGTTAAIVHQVLSECSERNLFPQLHNHMFDMCVEANHVHVLVKMASALNCKVRLNHIARRQTDKIKEGKVSSPNRVFNDTARVSAVVAAAPAGWFSLSDSVALLVPSASWPPTLVSLVQRWSSCRALANISDRFFTISERRVCATNRRSTYLPLRLPRPATSLVCPAPRLPSLCSSSRPDPWFQAFPSAPSPTLRLSVGLQ
ncbi:hypothetical protein F7725_019118 [Dissostichus mawsoni]|uniref:Uncharacterized protein n=1 Tax=Dissostichus mawsoni TaxID=36200 RepID=A0A7J5XU62_DISMA|nr:hypothetical protein F7725_019118 [Dissostichus mawsoni]